MTQFRAKLLNLSKLIILPPDGRRNICCAYRLHQTLSAECGGSSKRFAFSNKKDDICSPNVDGMSNMVNFEWEENYLKYYAPPCWRHFFRHAPRRGMSALSMLR